jgi:hypothetical protein
MNKPEEEPGSTQQRNVRRMERVAGVEPGNYASIESVLEIEDGVHEPVSVRIHEEPALALVYS